MEPAVPGTCERLSLSEAECASQFMESVIRAFEAGDAAAIQKLQHPGADPRSQKNSLDFNKSLMNGGDKVIAWYARPYSEPQWDIMRLVRHNPIPTIWIDVTLCDGQRNYPVYFACSPDKDGALRSCYYIDR